MPVATLADSLRRLNLPGHGRLPRLILMTDTARLPDPRPAVAGLDRGDAVILRHYDDPHRAALGAELLRLCRARGLRLLVAGDLDLALDLGCDGLHLPEWMLGEGAWRRVRGRLPLVTAAAHGPRALWRAARAGADATLLSPVFPTASHPGAPALGVPRFAALCRMAPLPVYALGGVTAGNLRRLKGSGLAGVAAIGGIAVQDSSGGG
ncbi:MAG: thiamine phosphate synthase [Hyphomicrobiales bacterium]|nr:thiamine phosphate synthase [Hyphomicrobiales bacterium]MCP5370479.1 thiamine phosphate synthase [Hyphomicrobiales bacterium]